MKCRLAGFFLLSFVLCAIVSVTLFAREQNASLRLSEGWALRSSAEVPEKGEVLSTPQFSPVGWQHISVPTTVLAALVRNGAYPDPYFGMNLRSIPGASYPIAQNFSNRPMPEESPFRVPWWFRSEFTIPNEYRGKTLWLHFDGINFRANVWLNGKQIADSNDVAGAFRIFEFDVTGIAKVGQRNALAVEVFPPQANDLAITWVDWNPAPPDKDMGLYRDVYLSASGPVALRWPHVVSKLDLPDLQKAHLTVSAELRNATEHAVKGTLEGEIDKIRFAQEVELGAHETRVVKFSPDKFSQLNISQPRLWWPAKLGPQNLYTCMLKFETERNVSDRATVNFGIREVTSELNEKGYRVFKVNGKNILIRGAGWAPDMMLRTDPARQEAELGYVLDMNLNTVRLEGKLEDEHFLEICDRRGILLQAGWCCCDHWEKWKNWKDEDYTISAESLKDQIRRLRSHPSLFDWLNGSDGPPPPTVEETYIKILTNYDWPNPFQSSATQKTTTVSGQTGLKMTGPYEYVAPSYWLTDTSRGGAFGYNTETGPGPAVPPFESLRLMLPREHLWPIDEFWDFHAGGGAFKNLNVFSEALNARYGQATSVEDYAWKAQLQAYEGERAMFEAFGRNKYTATGVIQWMLNNAWPSLIWHLYDYYLRPAGGYFGTKKACEPLHVQYSYDDRSIVVVNSLYEDFKKMKVTARVLNMDMGERFKKESDLDVEPDSSTKVFSIPELQNLSTTYFLKLTLNDAAGKTISSNFYWLSTKPETLNWEKSTWYYTPTKAFADYTALQTLPKVRLKVASVSESKRGEGLARVTVANQGPSLALSVHLKIVKGKGGEELLPIIWEDNYFTLLPGESRVVHARYRPADLKGAEPVVDVDGWNVAQ
ncbi:MAG: sugar-binding domain-containing protein [Terriglobia bacterium]